MNKLLTFILTLDNLSRIPRTGGILFSGIDPNRTNSIAEHNYKTSYLIFLLGTLSQKHGLDINLEKTISSALTHDWADCVLLDVPAASPSYKSYFHNVDIKEVYAQAENQARSEMTDYLSSEIDITISPTSLNDLESKLLKISDTLALLTEVLEWKFEGMQMDWIDFMWANTHKRFSDLLLEDFSFLSPLATELQSAFTKGSKPANPFLTKPQHQTLKK